MDMNSFSLQGKIAWITGASYGIGFAIAEAYAAAGAQIVFNDINQELVNKGLKAYEELGINAYGFVCDVTNETQVNELIETVEKTVGPINILVNNAGISYGGLGVMTSISMLREVFQINYFAQIQIMQMVLRVMMKQKKGYMNSAGIKKLLQYHD